MKLSIIRNVVFAVASLAICCAWAEKAETVGGITWIYEEGEEESFLRGITNSPAGTLTFPAELGGKPVRNLFGQGSYHPFSKYQWVEADWYADGGYWQLDYSVGDDWLAAVMGVVIPEGITNIYERAFAVEDWTDGDTRHLSGWYNLKTVTIPDSLLSCNMSLESWDNAFYGTPFLRSKEFPDFILNKSGTKLWGVKAYDGEWDYSVRRDALVPASVTEIADYALGCFGAYGKIEYVDGTVAYGLKSIFSEGNVRIVFEGPKPQASETAFAREWWDEYGGPYRVEWRVIYYHEGASGWKWGADWCGVKTCALNEVPEAYAKESNLKFGRVYGGEQSSGSGWSAHCIWYNNDIGLYGDEYALIPVTGTGTIKPVIYGDVPSGYLETAEIWTDQKMFDTFTPKGVATSKWKSDEDEDWMWYYETSKGDWEWPKEIWPKKKVVSNRRWIVIHAKEKKLWSGVWSFRVGLSGTSEVSDPIIVTTSEEFDGNGLLSKHTPSDFMRGLTFSGYENFEAWDEALSCYDYSYLDLNRPAMQTFEIENWRANLAGKAMTFKVAVPAAGTLVISSEDDDDDSPAMKKVFSITGSGIVSDKATVKSENWESPDYRYNVTNFWKTSNASHIRRIEVNKATTLTFTSKTDEDDCEFNRMYFFPKSGKSVAVEAGYIAHEDHDGAYDYWGRNYIQGYVTGGGVYKSGETATLKAVTGSGEKFDHWEVRYGNLKLTDEQRTSATLKFKVTDAMCGAMKDEAQIFLTAVWKPKYKVTALPAVAGAGTVTGTGRYLAGKTVTLTATPAKGYEFVEWSDGDTNPTRTVKVVAADAERVLYACFYKPPVYKIKFNANGGTGTEMKTFSATYGKNVTLTANAYKRTNYTFLGWATKKDATAAKYTDKQKVKNLTATDGKTVTLYAVWKRNTYTVKFNANGGEGATVKQQVNCGDKTALDANVYDRLGFKFAGWATKKGGAVVYKNKASVTDLAKNGKSVTLYAVWKPWSWAVGTFYASLRVEGDDWEWPNAAMVKVSSVGVVSMSITDADGVANPTGIKCSDLSYADGSYSFTWEFTHGKEHSEGECEISKRSVDVDDIVIGELFGNENGIDEDGDPFESEIHGFQNIYAAKTGLTLPSFKSTDQTLNVKVAKGFSVELTFNADGAVSAKASDSAVKMQPAHLLPYAFDLEGGVSWASLWLMGYQKSADKAVGIELDLKIPCNSSGVAKASKVKAEVKQIVLGD